MSILIQNVKIYKKQFNENEYFEMDFQVDFQFNFPFAVIFSISLVLNNFHTRAPHYVCFFDLIIISLIHFAVSSMLLSSAIQVFRDIFNISDLILHPEKISTRKKVIILNYNHCRFINNAAITKKKLQNEEQVTINECLKSFKIWFYISILSYIFNIILSIVSVSDILYDGITSKWHLYLICLSTFLTTSDITTIFTKNNKYNLVYVLIKKYSIKLLMFFLGVVFLSFSLILFMFNFLGDLGSFQTIHDCFNVFIALSQADSITDLIKVGEKQAISKIIIFSIVTIAFMSCTQIFIAIVTVGFQKSKEAFRIMTDRKAEEGEKFNQLTRQNLKQYDYKVRLKKQLHQELNLLFQRDIFNEKPINIDFRMTRKISFDNNFAVRHFRIVTEESRCDDSKKQFHSKQFVNDDNFISNSRNLNMHQREKELQSKEEVEIAKYISVFRNLCLELVVQTYFNFDILNKFFDDFHVFKSKSYFSFVQVIALWDICEDYLEKMKQLEMRMLRLQNKINIQS